VEPIMGKLEDDKPEWRKEALLLTEKILPKINSIAETLNIV
ncbi:2636_t:CDS:1, partial [Rhizophagus irregularis]